MIFQSEINITIDGKQSVKIIPLQNDSVNCPREVNLKPLLNPSGQHDGEEVHHGHSCLPSSLSSCLIGDSINLGLVTALEFGILLKWVEKNHEAGLGFFRKVAMTHR